MPSQPAGGAADSADTKWEARSRGAAAAGRRRKERDCDDLERPAADGGEALLAALGQTIESLETDFSREGSSLQAMQLALQLAEQHGVTLPPGAIFRTRRCGDLRRCSIGCKRRPRRRRCPCPSICLCCDRRVGLAAAVADSRADVVCAEPVAREPGLPLPSRHATARRAGCRAPTAGAAAGPGATSAAAGPFRDPQRSTDAAHSGCAHLRPAADRRRASAEALAEQLRQLSRGPLISAKQRARLWLLRGPRTSTSSCWCCTT